MLDEGWTLDELMAAVHRHEYADVAQCVTAAIAAGERTFHPIITVQDVEVFMALLLLGTVSDRQGRNNWKKPDTTLVFPGLDFNVYMPIAKFSLMKKYYIAADAGTAAEIAADPWMAFRGGIDKFNAKQRLFTEATREIVVDESMSAYEPQTSKCGNLPNLSFIIRKPQPLGTELKNAADGGTGLLVHLEIQEGKDAMHSKEFHGDAVGALGTIGATAACSLRLADAACPENGLMFGDSWFGSVLLCVAARSGVLSGGKKVHVMANIKTNHKYYPQQHIEGLLSDSPAGSKVVLTATVEGVDLVALGYRYNRKKVLCFVMTRGAGTTKNGPPYLQRYPCKRTRQVRQRHVTRPMIITLFFRHSALIDTHNQARQFLLALEKAWVVQCGFFRLSTTVLGMEVTNAWKAAKLLKPTKYGDMDVKEFTQRVAGAMLEHAGVKQRSAVVTASYASQVRATRGGSCVVGDAVISWQRMIDRLIDVLN